MILVCKLLIIQYLLINSYNSLAVKSSLESALTLLRPHESKANSAQKSKAVTEACHTVHLKTCMHELTLHKNQHRCSTRTERDAYT